MKKSLLFLVFLFFGVLGFSQNDYIFQVLTPEPLTNVYTAPNQVVQGGWFASPDLNIAESAVTAELVFVNDGTEADSLGCNALINGADVTGKIAVVYRGTCEFGMKATNAEAAGAIAVIIVNNAGGVVPMGAGAVGGNVEIPVVMISNDTGALLRDEIIAGNVTAYLGRPVYPNNVAVSTTYVLRPQWAAKPAAILQNNEDFTLPLGGYVYNKGTAFQTGTTLRATIMFNDDVIYDETASGGDLESNDSVYVALPTFSQTSYEMGEYNLTYQVSADVQDEFIFNDAVSTSFSVTDDMFSYAPLSPDTELPVAAQFYGVNPWSGVFEPCIHFRDPNASRLRADGMVVAATTSAGNVLSEQILEIAMYEWLDEFDVLDPIPTFDGLDPENPVAEGEYAYTTDAQGESVNIDFFEPFILEDNVRYLFCAKTETGSGTPQIVFLGFAEGKYDYTFTQEENQEPSFVLLSSSPIQFDLFGPEVAPALGVRMVDISVGTDNPEKVDITPFPNPTRDLIAIPYTGSAASATIHIYDLNGKLVKAVNANYSGNNMIEVDMNGVTNGSYVFNMQFNDNTSSTFKVVVAR